MRLLILSDLHHELWRESAPLIDPERSRPDVVILAGDIDIGARAVEWAARNFSQFPVLYVNGNHEAYGKNLEDMQSEIAAACALTSNVHFLDCGEYVHKNVRFLGATLWTDFRLFGDDSRQSSMQDAEAEMTDYKRIRLAKKGYRKLRAADTAQLHSIHKSWLQKKLDEAFDGKTVVITHMAPSLLSVPEKYKNATTSAAYASRLDELILKADLWVHGHMHESVNYTIGRCLVICNPCGYINRERKAENDRFDPNYVIELDSHTDIFAANKV